MRNTAGDEWGTVLDIVVDEYESPSLGKLEHLRSHVDAVADLLVAGGFRRHPGSRRRPEDLRLRQIQDLFADLGLPSGTERLLVYWAGHGRRLEHSGFFLMCSDSGKDNGLITVGDAMSPAYLGSLLAVCGAREIVLVMDACSSGGGAGEACEAFSKVLDDRRMARPPKLVVLCSVASGERAEELALSEAMRTLLQDPDDNVTMRGWGPRDRSITIDEMITALNAQLGSRQRLAKRWTDVFSTPFFPNPRYDPELPDTDLESRRARPVLLPADVREHFMLKFQGIDAVGDEGYFFQGRTDALRRVVTWLRTEDSGMFVVTGPPGSGKSALLGRLAVLSDASYHKDVHVAAPEVVDGAELGTLPDIGAIDVGIHARGKDVLDCVQALEKALGLEPPRGGWRGPEQLVSAVGRTNRRYTVLVDALDEARPEAVGAIAGRLLRPLADQSGVKVLVGTRGRAVEARDSAARDLLGILAPERRLDLDQDTAATEDIEAYAYKRLTDLKGSRYELADTERTRQAAQRVAQESESVFLMARLFTRALADRNEILDLDGPEAREIFRSRDVAEVFAADLARYGTLRQQVTDLLAPLAWALGPGLPKRTIWATAATALTGGARTYTEDDVAWVIANAGAHLIESGEEGQSVYRLYHQAYADYLRQAVATADRAPVFLYEAVLGTVPRTDGQWDWARATPYALKHLPVYALAAGRLEHLVQDTGILPYADPTRMMGVLNTPEQQRRSLPRLYLRVWDELRNLTPEDRAALLQLRAGIDEPDALPQLRTEAQLGWRVRWGNGRRTNFHGVLVGGPTSAVGAVAIDLDPDGTLTVAAGDEQGAVHLWDGASGALLHTLPTGHAPVTAVELTRARGRLLLAATSDYEVHLWDVGEGLPVVAPCSHRRKVTAMAFGTTADGEPLLATSARDGRIRLWDTDRGQPRQTWSGGGLGTRALALTSLPGIGDVLVAACTTGAVRTWNIAPSADVRVPRLWWRKWPGELKARYGMALSELDGRGVVVGRAGLFADGVRCLDLRTGAPVGDEDGTGDEGFTPRDIGFTPESLGGVKGDPAAFVTGGPEGGVRLRRGRGSAGGWTGHSGDVRAVAGVRNHSGDTFVVSGSQDGTVRLWNTAVSTADDHPQRGQTHGDALTSSDLVALPDGRLLLATGTADGTVWIWDGRTGRRIARCVVHVETDYIPVEKPMEGFQVQAVRSVRSGHEQSVTAVSWVPAGGERHATLVSASEEGSVQFWSTEGAPLIRHKGSGPVAALTATALDEDGDDGLIAVGRPHTIALHDSEGDRLRARFGSRVRLMRGHRRAIGAVAFAPQPDGTTWLASGDKGGKITLWAHPSGRPVGQLRGPGDGSKAHRGPVHSLASVLGPEGSMLVSADADVVRVWDLTSRSIRAEFGREPVRGVAAVATADGRILVAVPTADRTVEIWDAQAEARLGAVRGFPQPVTTVSMLRDRHDSDTVLLAVGHGRVVHIVELLEFSDRRRWKGTP
ncbi:hypothetical protein [Streptomyces roseochromogenus]|uniref:Uncharacterized protein n=1 Tax=Streptomyces roseochromogenus subsp. oscitans DS 12.976 TaxID=1352936 RepID=V6KWA0_STRRC|nr:hypothetical protein [Streptomyces roseochromogenus]EST36417.1 hypothetical protein M878_02210 [Streptomyces roseochromogenus subsp. oscitans DS 12.976]